MGDELFEEVIEAGYFAEVQAAITMQQMGPATPGAPGFGACRRDLKPKEFLFQTKKTGENNALKVTGQELSCTLAQGLVPTTKAGNFSYVTPLLSWRRKTSRANSGTAVS